MNQEKLQHLEAAAEHFGQSAISILKGITRLVAALAPAAEAVGVAIGNPEVAGAAKLAETVAAAAGAAEEALPAGGGHG